MFTRGSDGLILWIRIWSFRNETFSRTSFFPPSPKWSPLRPCLDLSRESSSRVQVHGPSPSPSPEDVWFASFDQVILGDSSQTIEINHYSSFLPLAFFNCQSLRVCSEATRPELISCNFVSSERAEKPNSRNARNNRSSLQKCDWKTKLQWIASPRFGKLHDVTWPGSSNRRRRKRQVLVLRSSLNEPSPEF